MPRCLSRLPLDKYSRNDDDSGDANALDTAATRRRAALWLGWPRYRLGSVEAAKASGRLKVCTSPRMSSRSFYNDRPWPHVLRLFWGETNGTATRPYLNLHAAATGCAINRLGKSLDYSGCGRRTIARVRYIR